MSNQSSTTFTVPPAYPRREQTFRAAEAENRAARPGMLKKIDGFADELFNALERIAWDGSEEVPVRRKKNSLKLYPLGILLVRRFHTRHRDSAVTNLWFGSDRSFYVGSAGLQRKLNPKKVKSFEQLRRLTELLPQALSTALERVGEHLATHDVS